MSSRELDERTGRLAREALPLLWLVVGPDDRVREANGHAVEALGRRLVGERFGDLLAPGQREESPATLAREPGSGRTLRLACASGPPRSLVFRFEAAGEDVLVVGAHDPADPELPPVTGGRAEEERQRAEARARAMFENHGDEMVLVEAIRDPGGAVVDWRWVDANERAVRNLTRGGARSDLLRRTLGELFPERLARVNPIWSRVLETGEPHRYETTFDGRDFVLRVFHVDGDLLGTSSHDVTAERRAQEALAASEGRLRSILEAAPVALSLHGPDGRIRYLNAAALALAGKPLAEVVGKLDSEVYPSQVTLASAPRLARACQGEPQRFDVDVAGADGGRRWFSVVYEPLRDPEGRVQQVLGVIDEVTDLRRGEAALRAQLAAEDRLAKVAATVPGLVCSYRLSPDGQVTLPIASDVARDLYGFQPAELARSMGPVMERVDPADQGRVQQEVAASARDLTPWHSVFRYHHPWKGVRTLEGWSMPRRESNGAVLWHGFVMDVSAQREAEQAAREAAARQLERERQLETVVRTALDGFVVVDAEARLREVNDAFCEMTGFSREELLALRIPDLELTESLDETRAHMARVRASGADRFETVLGRRDGGRLEAEMSVSLHGDMQFAFVRDISARKHAEVELRRSRMELRALTVRLQAAREEEKARIARDLHDDLGQALTGLQYDLRWLEDRIEARDPTEENLALLDRMVAASSLAEETLAAVQRITRELRPAALDQVGLAAALRQDLREFQGRTGLEVEVRMSVEGALAEDVATALYRICQEALTNVARHASARRVAVVLEERAGELVLEISDDGVGIAPKAAERPTALGLLGMKERARGVGGVLAVTRGKEGGTVVTTRVTVQRARRGT